MNTFPQKINVISSSEEQYIGKKYLINVTKRVQYIIELTVGRIPTDKVL